MTPLSDIEPPIENKLIEIHENILKWGMTNLRDFPWRKTTSPYKILLAEIMLHRTQAKQVIKIYNNFIQKYNDFCSICYSKPHIIALELKPLGLNWRSNLIYELSCIICNKLSGEIPSKKDELLELPGIGPYISSAFLCLSYNMPEPMLDTNTVRIIGRVFDFEINDNSRRNKKFERIMRALISLGKCKDFSLSMIDLADAICKPIKPLCYQCPINAVCFFYINNF